MVSPQKEIFDLFEVGQGKDVDVFYSIQDLKDKIDFYLTNEDIRMKMSKRLHNKVKEKHVYEIYHSEMLKIILDKNEY